LELDNSQVTKYENFKLKMPDGRHFKNRFFGHNSAVNCPIAMKFAQGSRIAWS